MGLVRLEYDISEDHALDQPRLFVRPLVDRKVTPAAIALGPDSIYFSPLRQTRAAKARYFVSVTRRKLSIPFGKSDQVEMLKSS